MALNPLTCFQIYLRKIAPKRAGLFFVFVGLLFAICFPCRSAQAYIGPGVGAGVLASVLGLVSSIFLALVAIIYYPIKRAVKKIRKGLATRKAARLIKPERR